MNTKKVGMIILLVFFIVIIGFVLKEVNGASQKKASQESSTNIVNNMENKNPEGLQASENVKKCDETVTIDMDNMIVITDNFFIEQTNDVYINVEEYIGKTIKIEGLIYPYEDDKGKIYYAVVRNTPGCCGNDGLAGIDIRYSAEYPEKDTWVEVTGVVGTDMICGTKVPVIQVASITKKEKGKTFVTN